MRLIGMLFLICLRGLASQQPYLEKADKVPNICQSCFPKLIRWGGKPHCAPAAVSNSLVWLAKNGFPSLQPFHGGDPNEDQARLVNLLGIEMGTTENGGTSPEQLLNGLKKYFNEKKVPYKRFAAVGWRNIPNFVSLDAPTANLDWIKTGTLGQNSIWILIGWYKYDSSTDNYKIFDGHWMTVVGYGSDRTGKLNPNILIVHDPAERADRVNYYATIEKLQHGSIDGSKQAAGALSISGDVKLKPGADFGLIQGAYRLEM